MSDRMDFMKLANIQHVEGVTPACLYRDIAKTDLGKVVAEVGTGGLPVVLSGLRCPDTNVPDRDGHLMHEAYGIAVILSVDEFNRLCGVRSEIPDHG